MSTFSCCKGWGSQEEGTTMPLLEVHGVKDTATGTALVISSASLVPRPFLCGRGKRGGKEGCLEKVKQGNSKKKGRGRGKEWKGNSDNELADFQFTL